MLDAYQRHDRVRLVSFRGARRPNYTEGGYWQLGMARPVAEAVPARYIRLDELRAEALANTLRLNAPTAGQAQFTYPG